MKIEHEKMNIEKEKVVLETKVKHIGEQSEMQIPVLSNFRFYSEICLCLQSSTLSKSYSN